MPDCQSCEPPPQLTPYNAETWDFYQLVSDQVRPALAGWPGLDMASVISIARELGWDEDLEDLLERVRRLHGLVGEIATKNAGTKGKKH